MDRRLLCQNLDFQVGQIWTRDHTDSDSTNGIFGGCGLDEKGPAKSMRHTTCKLNCLDTRCSQFFTNDEIHDVPKICVALWDSCTKESRPQGNSSRTKHNLWTTPLIGDS